MRICISEPIRRIALDFKIFRNVPGIAKNMVGALKKLIVNFILKDPVNNYKAVLSFNPRTAGTLKTSLVPYPKGAPKPGSKPKDKGFGKVLLPVVITAAITILLGILGPSVFSKDIEKEVREKVKNPKVIELMEKHNKEISKAIEGEFE